MHPGLPLTLLCIPAILLLSMSQGSLLPVTELTLLEPYPIFIPAQYVCLLCQLKFIAHQKKILSLLVSRAVSLTNLSYRRNIQLIPTHAMSNHM